MYWILILQDEQKRLDDELDKEVEELEKKYEPLRQTLYQRREELINGKAEPEEKELNDLKSYEDLPEDKVSSGFYLIDPKNTKEIPMFWLRAMKNNIIIRQHIGKSDEHILKSLIDIKGEKMEGKNYKLTFIFSENEHFHNKELTKTMIIDKDDDQKCLKSIGIKIDWKDTTSDKTHTSMTVLSMRNLVVNLQRVQQELNQRLISLVSLILKSYQRNVVYWRCKEGIESWMKS